MEEREEPVSIDEHHIRPGCGARMSRLTRDETAECILRERPNSTSYVCRNIFNTW